MNTKMLEIRDEGTCIACVAIRMHPANAIEAKYLWRCGYPRDGSSIVLMTLSNQKATSDPYEWPALRMGTRTMPQAHAWIIDHWDDIRDGDVIDVRVVLAETQQPCAAEIWTQ